MAKCCFSGHRNLPVYKSEKIKAKLFEIISNLCDNNTFSEERITEFISGGALGFDTVAAEAVLQLKNIRQDIKLTLMLPCETQSKIWDKKNAFIYESLKAKADKVIYISREYYNGCMFERNRRMVDESSVCVCYLTDNNTGTGQTVRYAAKNNLKIINLAAML